MTDEKTPPNEIPEDTVWKLIDSVAVPVGDQDLAGWTLLSEGREFIVSVSGPSGITGRDLVNALRAALTYTLRAVGAEGQLDLKTRSPNPGELSPPTGGKLQ